jgi:hypothetical protein
MPLACESGNVTAVGLQEGKLPADVLARVLGDAVERRIVGRRTAVR